MRFLRKTTRKQPQGRTSVRQGLGLTSGFLAAYMPTSTGNLTRVGAAALKHGVDGLGFTTPVETEHWTAAAPTQESVGQYLKWTILVIVNNATGAAGGSATYCERPDADQIVKLEVNNAPAARLTIRDYGPGTNLIQLAQIGTLTGVTDVIVGTRRGPTDHKLFINGQLNASETSTTIADEFNPAGVFLGRDPQDNTAYLASASMPLVLTWKRALTDTEIAQISANPWQIFRSPMRLAAGDMVHDFMATATQTTAGVTQTATAAARDSVAVTQTAAGVTQAATAAVRVTGSAAQTLAGVTQSATAGGVARAVAAQTLDGCIQAATARGVGGATAAQTTADVTQAATGAIVQHLSAAQTTATVAQSVAVVSAGAQVTATQTTSGVSQTATARAIGRASAAQTAFGVTQTAAAVVIATGGLIQQTTGLETVAANITPTLNGVTAGNLLVLIVSSSGPLADTLPTDSSGQSWTKATFDHWHGVGDSDIAYYYLLNANAGTHTVTWSCSGQDTNWALVEAPACSAIDVIGTAGHDNGLPTTSTCNLTTVAGNTIVFAGMNYHSWNGNADSAITHPPTGGWTGIYAQQNTLGHVPGAEYCYRQPTSAGAQSATWGYTVDSLTGDVIFNAVSFVKGTAPPTSDAYIPYLGPGTTYFPPPGQADRVLIADKAALQARLDAAGTIRCNPGDYRGITKLIVRSGQRVFVVPGPAGTQMPPIEFEAGCTDAFYTGNGDITFAGNATRCNVVAAGNITALGRTLDTCTFISCNQFRIDCSSGGSTVNCRFIRPHGHTPGFNGYGAFLLIGGAGRTSTNNVVIGYNALTATRVGVYVRGQGVFTLICADLEDYNTHVDNLPCVDIDDVTRFNIIGLGGDAHVNTAIKCGADKTVMIDCAPADDTDNVGALTVQFTSTAMVSIVLRSNLGTFQDLATGAIRMMDTNESILQLNGNSAAPTGANAAALRDAINYSVGTARTWARGPTHTPRDPTGPNWAVGLAGQAGENIAIQNSLNTAGINGWVELANRTYYLDAPIQQLEGQVIFGGPNTALVCKGNFDAIQTGFNGYGQDTTLIDIVMQGGACGHRVNDADLQLSETHWMNLVCRNMSVAGIMIDNAYALDNMLVMGLECVNCVAGIKQRGTGTGTENTLAYIDKVHFLFTQLLNCGYGLDWIAGRSNNMPVFYFSRIEGCTSGAIKLNNTNYPTFVCCDILSNAGLLPIDTDFDKVILINCRLRGHADNRALLPCRALAEGCTIELGSGNPSTLTIFDFQPLPFKEQYTLPVLLMNSTSEVKIGNITASRLSLVALNSILPSAETANWSKTASGFWYKDTNPYNPGGDTSGTQYAWLDSGTTPVPGSRFTPTATVGSPPVGGFTGTQTTAGVGQTATITSSMRASAAQTAASVIQSVIVNARIIMAAIQTLENVVQSATAAARSRASANQFLANVTQAATLALASGASATQTLAGVTQGATLNARAGVQANQTTQTVGQTATATTAAPPGAVADQTLDSVISTATAKVLARLQAAQQLPNVTQSATTFQLLGLAAAQTADPVSQNARIGIAQKLSAAQQLDNVDQASTISIGGLTGLQVLDNVIQLATLGRRYVYEASPRTLIVQPENRTLIVQPENRTFRVHP